MSPRSDKMEMAASRSGSLLSAVPRMAAARASCIVRLMPGSVSFAMARSSTGTEFVSREWNTASAAAARCAGSGDSNRTMPSPVSDGHADVVVDADRPRARRFGRLSGCGGYGPVIGPDVELLVRTEQQVSALQRCQDIACPRVTRRRKRLHTALDFAEIVRCQPGQIRLRPGAGRHEQAQREDPTPQPSTQG